MYRDVRAPAFWAAVRSKRIHEKEMQIKQINIKCNTAVYYKQIIN